MVLAAGEKVPADGLVIRANGIFVFAYSFFLIVLFFFLTLGTFFLKQIFRPMRPRSLASPSSSGNQRLVTRASALALLLLKVQVLQLSLLLA